MKILIRHNGAVIAEQTLETDREYLIGRADECDIRLSQSFISRKQAQLSYKDGKWWYQDLRVGHKNYQSEPQAIRDDQEISVEARVDLVTDAYISLHKTAFVDVSQFPEAPRTRRRMVAFASVVGFLAVVGALVWYFEPFQFQAEMEPTELFAYVRPRVVEFEKIRNEELIKQIKELANLEDNDFRESVGFCSGFIVAKNIVLTASHCVLGPFGLRVSEDFAVKTHDKKFYTPTRVLGFNTTRDFLYLEVPGLEEYKPLKFQPNYEIGEKVYTVGNVQGQGIAIREGIAASKTKDEDDPSIEYLRYSAAASPGNSGGPLVNSSGEVLGLVFARSSLAENYNLSTDSKELLKGMKQFVKNQDDKKVAIDLIKVPMFVYPDLFTTYALKYHYEWIEKYPEMTKKLKDMNISMTVPINVKGLSKIVSESFYTVLKAKYDSIAQVIEKDEESEGFKAEWDAQANETTPLIIPYPHYDRMDIAELTKDYFVDGRFEVYLPADAYSYKRFKEDIEKSKRYYYTPYSQSGNLLKEGKETKGVYLYDSEARDRKRRMYYLRGAYAYLDYISTGKWDQLRFLSDAQRDKIILGEKGLVISRLDNPFLKPGRLMSLTLSKLPEPTTAKVRDMLGREWSKTSWELFEQLHIQIYCLPLPQGHVCLRNAIEEKTPFLVEIREKSFLEQTLSEAMVQPTFWHVNALVDYVKQGHAANLRALHDIKITDMEDGAMQIQFKTLGVTYRLTPEQRPKMLRIVPALHYRDGKTRWMAVGFQGYYEGEKEGEVRFCGSDVQLEGIPTYADSIKFQESKAKKDSEDLFQGSKVKKDSADPKEDAKYVETKSISIRSLGSKATLASFCQSLTKHEIHYDFGNYEPHHFDYSLQTEAAPSPQTIQDKKKRSLLPKLFGSESRPERLLMVD